jgi:hypothetical protein
MRAMGYGFLLYASCGPAEFDGAAFCDALASHACEAFDACGCPEDPACHADQALACLQSFTGYVGAVSLGLLEADAAAAQACLDAYGATTTSCAAPTEQNRPRACQTIFLDPSDVGGLCTPIAVGLLCAGGAGACDGGRVCQGLTSEAGGCGLTGRCAGDAVCEAGLCVLPAPAGEPCVTDLGCTVGLVCAGGTCVAPGAIGAVCAEDGDCTTGATCDAGTCVAALEAGAACPGTGCGADATCVPTDDARACAPLGERGDSCESYDACAAGLLCDFTQTPGACVVPPSVGEPCPMGTCADDATCLQGTCVARAAVGEACTATYLGCIAGSACDVEAGVCASLGGAGDACLGDERACGAGLTCDPVSGTNTCLPLLEAGDPCFGVVGFCRDGLYCGGADLVCRPFEAPGAPCEAFDACGPTATCLNGQCSELPNRSGDACTFACTGDLRCTSAPGVCAAGVCALAEVPSAVPN